MRGRVRPSALPTHRPTDTSARQLTDTLFPATSGRQITTTSKGVVDSGNGNSGTGGSARAPLVVGIQVSHHSITPPHCHAATPPRREQHERERFFFLLHPTFTTTPPLSRCTTMRFRATAVSHSSSSASTRTETAPPRRWWCLIYTRRSPGATVSSNPTKPNPTESQADSSQAKPSQAKPTLPTLPIPTGSHRPPRPH